jgi:hypothetical protein
MRIQIKVEKTQYETTIAWLRDLIFGSVFSKDRYASFHPDQLAFAPALFILLSSEIFPCSSLT